MDDIRFGEVQLGKLAKFDDMIGVSSGVSTVVDKFSELETDFTLFKIENENRWNSYYVNNEETNDKIVELDKNQIVMKKEMLNKHIYTMTKINQERELITKFFSGYIDGMNGILLDYMDKKFSIQNKIIGILAALNIVMAIYIFI